MRKPPSARTRTCAGPPDGHHHRDEVIGTQSGAKVPLKPASQGTGALLPVVRAVCEAAGIKDILTKSMGSSNMLNIVQATFDALRDQRPRHRCRTRSRG